MMNRTEIINQLKRPLLIKETRVRRIYKGGALIDRFRGSSEQKDGFLPENWDLNEREVHIGLGDESELVKANKGAAGIDKQTIEEFEENS